MKNVTLPLNELPYCTLIQEWMEETPSRRLLVPASLSGAETFFMPGFGGILVLGFSRCILVWYTSQTLTVTSLLALRKFRILFSRP